MKNRLEILDIWVDPVDRQEAISKVSSFLDGDRACSIFASNPEKNFSVPKDSVLYEAFKDADLLIPDGIGIVLAAKLLYGIRLERVPGSEFIFDICSLASIQKRKVFFFGATEHVNKTATEKLASRFPGMLIAGRRNGYVDEEQMPALIHQINASEAEILFIALGSPRQEKWFASYKHHLKHIKVCQGIGGTLDTIVGSVKRAPEFWQNLNLEWFYRLIKEPKRIKRQKVLPLFLWLIMTDRMKRGNHNHHLA